MTIEVRGVCAGYSRDVQILHGVSLQVSDGAVVSVLGPNGSGKSTLLKAVMGYVPLSDGEVIVDGDRVDRTPVHRRAIDHGVAYVPQSNNVFGPLKVVENLELGGARLRSRDRRGRISELLRQYPELAELQRQRADSLSGGERQILAVARALMTRPRYLLLDEPSAGLSPLFAERLFAMLAELTRSDGVSVLVVEQNATESLAVSDRGVVLALGRVALEDTAAALLNDSRMAHLYLGGSAEP